MTLQPATAFFRDVWNDCWKTSGGSMPKGGFLFLAQADLFDALEAELLSLDRVRAGIDPPVFSVKSIGFKTATVFKLDQRGWLVRSFQAIPIKEHTMSVENDRSYPGLPVGGCGVESVPTPPYIDSRPTGGTAAGQLDPTAKWKNPVEPKWEPKVETIQGTTYVLIKQLQRKRDSLISQRNELQAKAQALWNDIGVIDELIRLLS
jgi:hypothetical protein